MISRFITDRWQVHDCVVESIMATSVWIAVLCMLLSYGRTQQIDLTRIPLSGGADVVRAVLSKLDASGIFEHSGNADLTNVFLRNMAYVETSDGTDPDYLRGCAEGGIWKVTLVQFQNTKEFPRTSRWIHIYTAITSYLEQDWRTVNYRDLAKPLYSGLTARLYLTYVTTYNNIPPTIRHAIFWSDTFKGSRGVLQTWLTATTRLQQIEGKS